MTISMKVTLDTNCIIHLEKNTKEAHSLRKLLSLHDAKAINLQMSAGSASERRPGKQFPTSFLEFDQRRAAVGLAHLKILPTVAYPGMAFAGDYYVPTGGDAETLEKNIYQAIFQNTPSTFESLKWSPRCDTLVLWSHIHFNGDVFVTCDQHFLRNKKQLIALGAGEIFEPEDAVRFIQAQRVKNDM